MTNHQAETWYPIETFPDGYKENGEEVIITDSGYLTRVAYWDSDPGTWCIDNGKTELFYKSSPTDWRLKPERPEASK